MKSILSTFMLFIIVLAISGCAINSRLPNDPYAQAAWLLDYMKSRLDKGDYEDSIVLLTQALNCPNGPEVTKKFLVDDPEYKKKLSVYFLSSSTSNDKKILIAISKTILNLKKIGVATPDELKAYDAIQTHAASGNQSGTIDWYLYDEISYIPSLNSTSNQHKIYIRTLETLKNKTVDPLAVDSIVKFIEMNQSEKANAEIFLKDVTLGKNNLLKLQKLFPSLIRDKLKVIVVNIKISINPSDRILEEDLRTKLASVSENYNILKNNDRVAPDVVLVSLEKHKYDERITPTKTRTITYSYFQVDTFNAVTFMPNNASYMFDLTSSGMDLEYGYTVKIQQGTNLLLDELFRGDISLKYSDCINRRIVNVFGGTSGANFIANDNMRSICSQSSSEPTTKDLKNKFIDLLADKITSVDILEKRKIN